MTALTLMHLPSSKSILMQGFVYFIFKGQSLSFPNFKTVDDTKFLQWICKRWYWKARYKTWYNISSDSKVHGANMRPTWVLSAPDGPHIHPKNLAIRVWISYTMPLPCHIHASNILVSPALPIIYLCPISIHLLLLMQLPGVVPWSKFNQELPNRPGTIKDH